MFGSAIHYGVSWQLDNFDATSALDRTATPPPTLCDAEAHLAGDASVKAKVLGSWIDVFDASANVDTSGTVVNYVADVRVLGVPFYNPSGSSDLTFAVSQSKSTTETLAEVEGVIPVLGVPVTLKAGATGTLAVAVTIDNPGGGRAIVRDCSPGATLPVRMGLHGQFKPSAQLDGFASASIDLGIAEGGIKGDVTLLRLEVPLDLTVAIGLAPTPNQGPPQATLDVNASLALQFSTLDGRIAAFLDYPLGSLEWTLASWSGLHYSHDVFDRKSSVPLDYITKIDKLGAP
jgi:hypothetical protein